MSTVDPLVTPAQTCSPGADQGGRAETDLRGEIRPERGVGSRPVEHERADPCGGCSEPHNTNRGLGGGIATDERPSTEGGIGSAEPGSRPAMPRVVTAGSSSAAATRSGITTPARPEAMSAALLPRPKFTSSGSSNEFGLLGRLAPRHAIRDGGLGKAFQRNRPSILEEELLADAELSHRQRHRDFAGRRRITETGSKLYRRSEQVVSVVRDGLSRR